MGLPQFLLKDHLKLNIEEKGCSMSEIISAKQLGERLQDVGKERNGSFTDGCRFTVMRELPIRQALTLGHHFR
jgi:predicted nucleic acid-binding protein